MIPSSEVLINNIVKAEQPSKTWYIDFEKNRIMDTIDGLEAVKHAAFSILNTERYEFPIYSFNYGSELKGLIGKSRSLVKCEMNRRIREALTQDDRIKGIDNFELDLSGDSVVATFTVISSYGNFEVSQEVNK